MRGIVTDDPPLRTILVVDDDAQLRRATRRVLEKAGFRVEVLKGGAEAIARLSEARLPAAVLVDLRMPMPGGEEVLAHARATAPDLPVVMVSGCFDDDIRKRLLAGGARACVDKPPNFVELVALLRGLVLP